MTKDYVLKVKIDEFYLTEETKEKDISKAVQTAMKVLSSKGIYFKEVKEENSAEE